MAISTRKVLKVSLIILAAFVVLLQLGYFLLKRPAVQTYLTSSIAGSLADELNTAISIQAVDFRFFDKIRLDSIYIEDLNQDTLLYIDRLEADIGVLELMNNKVEIEALSLSDSKIYFHKNETDSFFNFRFIIDALSSEDTTGSFDWDITFGTIALHNLYFRLSDESAHNLLIIDLPDSRFAFDTTDLAGQNLVLNKGLISKAKVTWSQSPDSLMVEPEIDYDSLPFPHLNTSDWRIKAHAFQLKGLEFRLDNLSQAHDTSGIDFRHLHLADIQLKLTNGAWVKDTIDADIRQLSFIEQSGFTLQKLQTKARITTQLISCDSLLLITPNSRIGQYYEMKYKSFHDFSNFTEKVKLKADFRHSRVDFRDIAYFAPPLAKRAMVVNLNGMVKGRIDRIRSSDLQVNLGRETSFKGKISLRGLPDIRETFIDLDVVEIKSTPADFRKIFPDFPAPDNIAALGKSYFNGRFTGFINDFVAFGNLQTSIGRLVSDINMKVDSVDSRNTTYSGKLSAYGFDLGQWYETPDLLGDITLNAAIKGSGIKLGEVNATIKGNIDQFEVNRYNYTRISVDGEFDKKLFSGNLDVADPNLQLNFKGSVDFNDTIPVLNFRALVSSARLKALQFSDEDYIITTKAEIDLIGDNPDNLQGDISLDTLICRLDSQQFVSKYINIGAASMDTAKFIIFESDIIDGEISGNYTLAKLPDAFMQFLQAYLPSLALDTTQAPPGQNFRFSFTLKDLGKFTRFFYPAISQVEKGEVSGSFNLADNRLLLNGRLGGLNYGTYRLRGLRMFARTNKDQLSYAFELDTFQLNDSIMIDRNKLSATLAHDSILFALRAANESLPNRLDLHGLAYNSRDSLMISLLPSELFINHKKWDIAPGNRITIRQNALFTKDFYLQQEQQVVALSSSISTNYASNLGLQLNRVELHDILQALNIRDQPLNGHITGTVKLTDIFGNLGLAAYTFIDEFSFEQDTLGNLEMSISSRDLQDSIYANIKLDNENRFASLKGWYHVHPDPDRLDFRIRLGKMPLVYAEQFIPEFIEQTKGHISSALYLKGDLKQPELTGTVLLHDAVTTFKFLQTRYAIKDDVIRFSPTSIDIKELTLSDTLENTAALTGSITHQGLRHFNFDIDIETDELMVLNTTFEDNNLFYGQAFTKGKFSISGPLKNIELYAAARSLKGTAIYIPISDALDISRHDFITFVRSPDDVTFKKEIDLTGLTMNFDLDVTPDAEIQIIFDEQTGDIIKSTGQGNIKMEITTLGDFNMYGSYTIDRGDYLFTLQNVINKRFRVGKGGTINWSGSPYEARIDINAIYKLRASTIDLLGVQEVAGLTEEAQKTVRKRVPIELFLNLSGSLLHPNIDFNIEVSGDEGPVNSQVARRIREIEEDKNDLNKQVFGLLVLNRFIPLENTGQGQFISGVNTSVSELLTSQLSNWLSQYRDDIDFDINLYSYKTGLSGGSESDQLFKRRELQVALTKRFFNDRVSVNIGGNLDVGGEERSTSGNVRGASTIAGDFILEYKVTEDGKFRVKLFRKSDYDIFAERYNKTGVGFFYRKEFDQLNEFWANYRRKKMSSGE